MLEKLKALNANTVDKLLELEEILVLSAFARELKLEHEAFNLEVPLWLVSTREFLQAEISRRTLAARLSEIRRLEAEIESYKTAGEKKQEAANRLAALKSAAQPQAN